FVGVQPESAVRALIDRFVPREADAVIERAQALARAGNITEAIALLRETANRDPRHDKVKIELARLLSSSADGKDVKARVEEAQRLLDSLSVRTGADPDVEALRARLALQGKYEDAMEEFLELVRRDRRFRDDAGRKGLLAVFNLVGSRDPRV